MTHMTLSQLREGAKLARDAAVEHIRDVEREDGRRYPWKRSGTPMLLALNAKGDRILGTDSDCIEFKWRMSQIDDLLAKDEDNQIQEICVQSQVMFAGTREELDTHNYGSSYWHVIAWRRDVV